MSITKTKTRGEGPTWNVAVLGVLLALAARASSADDRIVLRNTQVITGKTVVSFDPDGVRLSGNPPQVLGWDEIESGRVAVDQARFNATLKQLGDPLFRIRRRLNDGDYRDLVEPSEAVFPQFAARRSPTAYMVVQALMWGRLAEGRRESALEPYLLAQEILRASPRAATGVPGERKLAFDPTTGLSPDLLPIWFDRDAAKAALPGVVKTLEGLKPPVPPGLWLYAGTLAMTAGDSVAADRLLGQVKSDTRAIRELLQIAAAQREMLDGQPGASVASLKREAKQAAFVNKPLAHYWLGLAGAASADETRMREGVLELLHLPALYGQSHPELAAAGLYQAQKALEAKDDPAATTLRSELLTRYAATTFAARLQSELGGQSEKRVGPENSGHPSR